MAKNIATRRNITITDTEIDDFLDNNVSNVSAFIQDALRYYIKERDKKYVTQEEFEILNRNYLEMRDILNELVQTFMK